ncbi:hypothetical protein ACQP1V_17500 [Microtetraspora malaysiensis]|uniref:hypothetical protein n=1 Tax=Microtetraspora malaysiensis TaxID=161358 RepID=UPI003D8EFA35
MPVAMIGSGTAPADRTRMGKAGTAWARLSWAWAASARTSSVRTAPRRTQTHRDQVGVAVTGGPVAMLPPMAGALPPTTRTLTARASAVMGRTVRARSLVVIAE